MKVISAFSIEMQFVGWFCKHPLDSCLGSDFVSLGGLVFTKLLLEILSSLHARGDRGGCAGLPGGSSDVADATGVFEHGGDLFKWFACCLREAKEDVEPHGNAEDAENNVDLPSDVDESWGDKIAYSAILLASHPLLVL